MVEEDSSEKKIVCGKCKGTKFNALVSKTSDVVVINFACTSCGHKSRLGIKRSQPPDTLKPEPRQSSGFFEKLTGAFGKKKSAASEEGGSGEPQWGWEENLDSLLEEK